MARALVVHPPVSVARDFIDYPQVADLGAVQLAAALRARGHDVRLVDAYALPGSTLRWRDDGRAFCRGRLRGRSSMARSPIDGRREGPEHFGFSITPCACTYL